MMGPLANTSSDQPGLIVNADDYGYFRCVSRGILEAAAQGIVTATGVIATHDTFDACASELRACTTLDAGIHLNLSWGRPLTQAMREKCAPWGRAFPGKYRMVIALLSGAVRLSDIENEWRAQIERCRAAGLDLRFMNSHEHVHMLPPLFGVAKRLAREHGIDHVRFTTAERPTRLSAGNLVRGTVVGGLQLLCGLHDRLPAPRFLGLEPSGRLGEAYLHRVLNNLRPGRIYELMCHPGRLDRSEVGDPRLLAYHDWDGERAALTRPFARELLAAAGVRLLRYRDLLIDGGRLVARAPEAGTDRDAEERAGR